MKKKLSEDTVLPELFISIARHYFLIIFNFFNFF